MPLHCGIFYVAYIVPPRCGQPASVLFQFRPVPGKALLSAAPAGEPGRLLRCLPFPRYGRFFQLYSCLSAPSASCCRRRFCPPACRSQRLCGPRFARTGTASRSRCARLCFDRLFSGHPTSVAGHHNGFCNYSCIAHRNQPLSSCLCFNYSTSLSKPQGLFIIIFNCLPIYNSIPTEVLFNFSRIVLTV